MSDSPVTRADPRLEAWRPSIDFLRTRLAENPLREWAALFRAQIRDFDEAEAAYEARKALSSTSSRAIPQELRIQLMEADQFLRTFPIKVRFDSAAKVQRTLRMVESFTVATTAPMTAWGALATTSGMSMRSTLFIAGLVLTPWLLCVPSLNVNRLLSELGIEWRDKSDRDRIRQSVKRDLYMRAVWIWVAGMTMSASSIVSEHVGAHTLSHWWMLAFALVVGVLAAVRKRTDDRWGYRAWEDDAFQGIREIPQSVGDSKSSNNEPPAF